MLCVKGLIAHMHLSFLISLLIVLGFSLTLEWRLGRRLGKCRDLASLLSRYMISHRFVIFLPIFCFTLANIHDAKMKIQCRFYFIGCSGKDRHNTCIHAGGFLRCALLSQNAQTQHPVYTPWCTHHPPQPQALRSQHQCLCPLVKSP